MKKNYRYFVTRMLTLHSKEAAFLLSKSRLRKRSSLRISWTNSLRVSIMVENTHSAFSCAVPQ